MLHKKIHQDFKLNGYSFSSEDELMHYTNVSFRILYNFLENWFSEDDFITVKTSGSTGKPKDIELKKEAMINSALTTGAFFNLPEKTPVLMCLSIDYIAGKMMLVRALTLGWHIDVFAPASTLQIHQNYDFAAMVPLQVHNSLSEIKKIKKLIIGGGAISNSLKEKLQKLDTKIYATYGMTETITHIAAKKINHLEKKESNFYHTLPNISIAKDERNCLVIKAPKLSNKTIITNDVVRIISDSEFEWLGRYDNIINSGGIKLYPEEIENKLGKIIKQRFFVAPQKDDILGHRLILIIEGEQTNTIDLSKIDELKKTEFPKKVFYLSKFIETETKKIQRKKTLALLNL